MALPANLARLANRLEAAIPAHPVHLVHRALPDNLAVMAHPANLALPASSPMCPEVKERQELQDHKALQANPVLLAAKASRNLGHLDQAAIPALLDNLARPAILVLRDTMVKRVAVALAIIAHRLVRLPAMAPQASPPPPPRIAPSIDDVFKNCVVK